MTPRQICNACDRPLVTCLCDAIIRRHSRYRLTILQHPKEAGHALSSAPLLQRSIVGSRLIIAEVFDPREVIGSQWRDTALLLYPGEPSITAEQAGSAALTELVVLDGTWRKTAKLLHLNPWLGELPRLALQPSAPSRYRIRKAPRADSLATIEAAAEGLNMLHNSRDFSAITGAFERMIEQQIEAMGVETFKRNYPDQV